MRYQVSRQSGFTLIELIIVIIMLGVLSVTALPRFVNLSSEANAAVINTLAGALKSTANIAHTKAIIAKRNGGFNNGFDFDGVYFDKSYPLALSFGDSDGIPEIMELMSFGANDFTWADNFTRVLGITTWLPRPAMFPTKLLWTCISLLKLLLMYQAARYEGRSAPFIV